MRNVPVRKRAKPIKYVKELKRNVGWIVSSSNGLSFNKNVPITSQ